jgi:hypothetical protein
MWFLKKFRLMKPEDDGGSGGGGDQGGVDQGSGDQGGDAKVGDQSQAKGGDQGGKPSNDGKQSNEGKQGHWPENWHDLAAKGDEKRLNALKRYASPEAMADALIAAQNRIRSGELKAALPKDAKPEEIAAWRAENGIPESPEKYEFKFADGTEPGKEDGAILDGFRKMAHTNNMHPDVAKSAVEWYYDEVKRVTDERIELDNKQRQDTEDALRAEWGDRYRQNKNVIEGFLTTFPESVRDAIKSARLPDGTGFFNHPDIMRGFVAAALEANPNATVVPGSGGDQMKGLDDEIANIEKTMRENRTAYNKDEKMQARYRELLGARQKVKERKAA